MISLRKFLGLKNQQEKLNEYRSLVSQLNQLQTDAVGLAESYDIYKSTDPSAVEDITRYNAFLEDHKLKVSDLCNKRIKIEKSIEKLENSSDIALLIKELKEVEEIKAIYKSGKIRPQIYLDLLKAKETVVRFADVMLWKGDKFLIMQRTNENGGNSGLWCVPGGHVDAGEDFKEAAKRELYEETGFDLDITCFSEIGIYKAKGVEIHYFCAYLPNETDTSAGLVRLDAEEEIRSSWIKTKEIDMFEFVFDMKQNLKKLLNLSTPVSVSPVLLKAFSQKKISADVLKESIKGENRGIEDFEIIKKSEVIKAMLDAETAALKKESLEGEEKDVEEKKPKEEEEEPKKEDDIEKSQEDEGTGFVVSVEFNDLDQANLFKSLTEELRQNGKLTAIEKIEQK